MMLKTVVWLAVCLTLCGADQIRILNSDSSIQDDPVARNAFKSKIRSLTLKSSIERALSSLVNEHSGQHNDEKKPVASTKFVAPFFVPDSTTATTPTTTVAYNDGPQTTVTPITSAPVGPSSGCFRLVPCCCNETKPEPQPYVTPKTPCSGGAPIPGTPQGGQSSGTSCSGCCGVAVSTPCYSCPCLSQCSIVPASGCPCGADLSVEYQCPNAQPQGVSLNELSDWIRQGYRLLDNLRIPPDCSYIPGAGIPSGPVWPGSDYNTHPIVGSVVSNAHSYKVEQPGQFIGLNQEENAGQSPNSFPVRQLRQRSFVQQNTYARPGYQPGPIPGYPHIQQGYPQPQPGYPHPQPGYVQPRPAPIPQYPLPPSGGYPVGPGSYAQPTSYPSFTTATPHQHSTTSSGTAHLTSLSAAVISLTTLIVTAFLIK